MQGHVNRKFRLKIASLSVIAIASFAPSASAEALVHVQASSELDDGKPRSYVYNAVDGKEKTTWCSKADEQSHSISLSFKKSVEIKTFGLVAGAIKDGALDESKRSVKKILLSDGVSERELTFQKDAAMQAVELSPPLKGRSISIVIKQTRGDENAPLCLGEILLKNKRGGALSGARVGTKVRSLSTPARRLLGTWTDSIDAPERTLTLALDGTFSYRYEPLLDGKPVVFRGKWRGSHKKLTLERSSKRGVNKLVVDKDAGTLVLSGAGVHETLASEYVRVDGVL